jgi:peptidoglycan/xylan/chitin deacetylase (PgdA/CDA1 family)
MVSLRRPLIALLAAVQALLGRRARILCYHSISNERADRWSNGRRQFAAHLQLLRREGWQILPLAELAARLEHGEATRRLLALTFDDGYLDFLENALPLLQDAGAPASLFVPAGLLGGMSAWLAEAPSARLLAPAQIEQVARAGVEVGSHGLAHRRLPGLDAAGLAEEVEGSRRMLEQRLGSAPLSFSYPYGEYGDREVAAVRAAGYRLACGFGGLFGNGPASRGSSPFALFRLKRDFLTRPDGDAALLDILSGRKDLRRAMRSERVRHLLARQPVACQPGE